MRITSTRNPTVKFVRSLERARARRESGLYLAEGVRLVMEAVQTGQNASLVLYDPDLLIRSAAGSSLLARLPGWAEEAYEVPEHVLQAAAQTEHPAGVVAVLRHPEMGNLRECVDERFGVILDGVADPGNSGTILRTAAAAGAAYVVSTPGSADLFAPKVVRAGMGAHFRLRLFDAVPWDRIRRDLEGVVLVATDVEGGTSVYQVTWPERAALIAGGEAAGMSREGRDLVDMRVHIPMVPGVESLNVSVATGIILYEALGRSI